MSGLGRVLKATGSMIVKGADGSMVLWVWDYAQDKPRRRSDMTKDEVAASEKAKWTNLNNHNAIKD